MITIFTAMYAESAMLIRHYGLKQNHEISAFPVFEKEDVKLRVMITGVGEIKAAAAVGAAGILFPFRNNDAIINFGICKGPSHAKGDLFLVNKIAEEMTGRTFYPDMLLRSDIKESTLVTAAKAVAEKREDPALYDMEAAAVYQAASVYMGPHQMSFLKLVSDSGEAVEPKAIPVLIEAKETEICSYIDNMLCMLEKEWQQEFVFESEYEEIKHVLSASLHCSDYMEKELTSLLRYAQLCGRKINSADPVFAECKTRREGKVKLDAFRKSLTE